MCFKYTINPPLNFEGVYVSTISELRSQKNWAIITEMRGLVGKKRGGGHFFCALKEGVG